MTLKRNSLQSSLRLIGDGGLCSKDAPPSQLGPDRSEAPGGLPFQTHFPTKSDSQGLAPVPGRTWSHLPPSTVQAGAANPPAALTNGTADATCCFAGSQTLEETHSACHVFSRGTCLHEELRPRWCSTGPGPYSHRRPSSSLCDIRWGISPAEWQEAPRQPGLSVPGRHLQWHPRGLETP